MSSLAGSAYLAAAAVVAAVGFALAVARPGAWVHRALAGQLASAPPSGPGVLRDAEVLTRARVPGFGVAEFGPGRPKALPAKGGTAW